MNEGQVLPTDHYWYEGMPDWRLLADLIALAESESEPVAPQPPSSWEAGEFTTPPPCPVERDSGELATSLPVFRRLSVATVTTGCVMAFVLALALYAIVRFQANGPETPLPAAAPNRDLERTDSTSRARATNELMARVDKLPTVASPPLFTFYSGLTIAIQDPPAELTVRIRGAESIVDPATRAITQHMNFVLAADFRQDRWFFRYYHASGNDLVHGTAIAIGKDDHDRVPPAIVSLLGLDTKSD